MAKQSMRFLPCVLILVLCTSVSSGQTKSKDDLEKSVDRALKFLSQVQDKDGSWRLQFGKSSAATSLAIMAYLSAGHVPGEGPYGEVVEKGIKWVIGIQRPNGLLSTSDYEMYQHGISTLMLSEVFGMCDAKLSPKIKNAVEKGVKLILKAQRKNGDNRGGWRYNVYGNDSDMSVTGWQLLALKAARNIGCDVPADRIQMAVDYVKRSHDKQSGGFRYTVHGEQTVPCSGTGILCLELCDEHHSVMAKRAGAFLLRHPPQWQDFYFFYNIYYCSQATFQLGGNYWEFYRPRLHKVLFAHQKSNGCWLNPQVSYGPVYGTSMAVLALTVEYRFLPIYQRGFDTKEEAGK